MNRNLLLISNSTNAGEQYLAWPQEHLKSFYQGHRVKDILFVPYAGVNLAPERKYLSSKSTISRAG